MHSGNERHRRGRRVAVAASAGLLVSLAGSISAATDSKPREQPAADGLVVSDPYVVVADGRELIVVDPPPGVGQTPDSSRAQSASTPFAAETVETASRRTHIVTYDGDTYRATTPRDGPRSWTVFDPGSRTFRSLLPSIRVELDGNVLVDQVTEAIGAVRVTRFDSLGFAVFGLPADLHPVEAVHRVAELPGRPRAAVRLRSPRIKWK